MGRSAGWDLRPLGSSGETKHSRWARGVGMIASKACFGPIPLRWSTFG